MTTTIVTARAIAPRAPVMAMAQRCGPVYTGWSLTDHHMARYPMIQNTPPTPNSDALGTSKDARVREAVLWSSSCACCGVRPVVLFAATPLTGLHYRANLALSYKLFVVNRRHPRLGRSGVVAVTAAVFGRER